MQELAKAKGGKCLSKRYVNSNTKLKWKCKEGHVWETIPKVIIRGGWCPMCGKKNIGDSLRGNIEDIHELAKAKGGKCLSKLYINAHTKLKWKCKEGHKWEATSNSIQQGHWCPTCAREKRKKD